MDVSVSARDKTMRGKNLFSFFSKSFLAEVILLITFLIVIVLTIQTFIYVQLESRNLENTLIKNKKDFTELLSTSLGTAQEIGGFAFQSQLIKESGETEDTVYVRFVKPSGEIYLSNIVEEKGNIINDSAIHTNETFIKDDIYKDEKIKVVISPGTGGYTAWLGFSLKSIQRIINSTILSRVILSIGICLTSIAFSYFLATNTTMPIKQLRDVVEKVGKGNLNVRAKIKSKNEIGQLASAFNQMTSDLKKSREKLEKYSRTLEKRVAERTEELNKKVEDLTEAKTAMLSMMEDLNETNKKLVETQRELKKSYSELKNLDVEKDRFISIAAHELKTPMTAISGFSQLLENKNVIKNVEKRNKYLNIIDAEAKRLGKLVTSVLELSRADLGSLKFVITETNIKEILEEIVPILTPRIKDKGLKITFDTTPNLPIIKTDKEKLKEIIINLIDNAIKYTDKGGIRVGIYKGDDHIKFSVADTGIGIPKKSFKKMFTRFYQVESPLTRKIGGTGLGLSICKEYVQALGGKIWFDSKVGKGTTFYFTLPLKTNIK